MTEPSALTDGERTAFRNVMMHDYWQAMHFTPSMIQAYFEDFLQFENEWAWNDHLKETYELFFTESDVSEDGILDSDEYAVFEGKIYDYHVADWGGYLTWTDEDLVDWYVAINTITSDVEGISMDDYSRRLDIASLMYHEIKLKPEPITEEERSAFEALVALMWTKTGEMSEEALAADYEEFNRFENMWVYNDVMVYYKNMDAFVTADADANDILSEDEYLVFEQAIYDARVESYGDFFEWTADEYTDWYIALNSITPDTEGISLDDFHRSYDIAGLLYIEIPPEPMTDDERALFWDLIELQWARVGQHLESDWLAADYAEYMNYQNDWEYNDMLLKKYYPIYTQADANSDGVLNREEYAVYEAGVRQLRVATYGGFFEAWTDDELDLWYEALDSLTPGTDGVSPEDYARMMDIAAMIAKEMPTPLTDDEREAFTPLALLLMEKAGTLSEEALAADYAEYEEYLNNWVYNDMLVERYSVIFDNNDENRDGLLDIDEFYAYEDELYDDRVDAYGSFFYWEGEELDLWFEAQDALSPDVDGVTMDDIARKLDIVAFLYTEFAEGGNPDQIMEGLLEGFIQCKEDKDCDEAGGDSEMRRRRLQDDDDEEESTLGSGEVADGARCLYVDIVGTMGSQPVDEIKQVCLSAKESGCHLLKKGETIGSAYMSEEGKYDVEFQSDCEPFNSWFFEILSEPIFYVIVIAATIFGCCIMALVIYCRKQSAEEGTGPVKVSVAATASSGATGGVDASSLKRKHSVITGEVQE